MDEKKNKIISGLSTAIIMVIVIIILMAFGYMPPDPPIPEEGVEVALGYDEDGLGTSMPSETAPDYSRPAAAEDYSTQSTDESVYMPSDSKGSKTNPNAEVTKKDEHKEPEINQKALFPGRKNNTQGGQGQGDTKGGGQQGDPNGTPGATNYHGNPGHGSYSLGNRGAVALPQPSYNSNRMGKVVVKIWVDRNGNVTKVDAPYLGSTLTDEDLVNQAKSAAKRAKFDAAPNAAEIQTGTITYNFKRVN